MRIRIPDYLKRGDTIGIVAPAGYMPIEKIQSCIETLDAWDFNVRLGSTTHSGSANYFSGTDEERLKDLQEMLDDATVKAVLCARGGYGVSRIIDQINFKRFKKHPKWIIGFSDITVLHTHLLSQYGIASLHAPMAAAFNDGEYSNKYILSLRDALVGKHAEYESTSHSYNKTGKTKGVLVGGNLCLLSHLNGTPSEIKTKNRILFLEDVGEYLYNIDRMFLQLKRAGKLRHLSGLIIGRFTDCKDTDRPFGKDVYEIIYDQVKEFDYPICFDFPVSHDRENYALKIGGKYELEITDAGVKLFES